VNLDDFNNKNKPAADSAPQASRKILQFPERPIKGYLTANVADPLPEIDEENTICLTSPVDGSTIRLPIAIHRPLGGRFGPDGRLGAVEAC
jgi:hypothetical protein